MLRYIYLLRGWMYLVAIIDWHSHYVVNWDLDQTLKIPFILNAVRKALSIAAPVVMNCDQGSHFTSPQYLQSLKDANV